MCKKYPGPRCSACTRKILTQAQKAFDADPTDANRAKRDKAQYDFNTSPDGIAALKATGTEKGDLDALHFSALRETAVKLHKVAEAKETKAMQGELRGLYSSAGIAELRSIGDDDLADKLEERKRRIVARRERRAEREARETAKTVTNALPETTPAPAAVTVHKPSGAAAILKAAGKGAYEGFRNPHAGVMSAVNRGISVGKGETQKAQATQERLQQEYERAVATHQRDEEKAKAQHERELATSQRDQERYEREQERIEKADLAWHSRLEAECKRYIKAQQREANQRSNEKRPKPEAA